MDDTLHDDYWKDSFDKLLEPRPLLRQLNIIKKDVRASFNIDSSVENSNHSIGETEGAVLNVKKPTNAQKRGFDSISTPLVKTMKTNPFLCPISPITDWLSNTVEKRGRKINLNEDHDSIIAAMDPPQPIRIPKKRVCFDEFLENKKIEKDTRKRSSARPIDKDKEHDGTLTLQPGKWRKSLSTWRRTHQLELNKRQSGTRVSTNAQSTVLSTSVEFVAIFPFVGKRKSILIKDERISNSRKSSTNGNILQTNYEKDVLKRCGQRRPKSFAKVYPAAQMTNCRKIGEGAYGEVYMNTCPDKECVVMKIIPIEGSFEVNGEAQKTYEQILPEIIISTELSNLRDIENKINSTNGFNEIIKVMLVVGKYPTHLIKLWEKYDEEKESENEHPDIFNKSQIYVVLEMKFGGIDLASFEFNNAEQSYYALIQIIFTLAIGEEAYQFEHRDLHWGNVLLINTDDKNISFKFNDKTLTLPTKGVKVTIIDYTLSRITFNYCCLYNDLSSDEELFVATGDYQYDIYRMMRDVLKNNWSAYEPKTNVFWISYIISKLIDGVHYRQTHTKPHKMYMQKFRTLQKSIMSYTSAFECAKSLRKIT